MNDINRAHSAAITLDTVAKQRQGKMSTGPLAAVFLPLKSMVGKYPRLMPAAWMQRVGRYLAHSETRADPAASVRSGDKRVELLREYGIIELTQEGFK